MTGYEQRIKDMLKGAEGYWIRVARVRIRRDPKFGAVRPEAEQLDGKSFFFKFIGDDDSGRYPGEEVWQPWDLEYPADGPPWIAEGDLDFDCEPIAGERLLR